MPREGTPQFVPYWRKPPVTGLLCARCEKRQATLWHGNFMELNHGFGKPVCSRCDARTELHEFVRRATRVPGALYRAVR